MSCQDLKHRMKSLTHKSENCTTVYDNIQKTLKFYTDIHHMFYFLQEQEMSELKRASRKRPVSQTTSSWFYKPDEDQGPPGSCGGSSFDSSGPRFVF